MLLHLQYYRTTNMRCESPLRAMWNIPDWSRAVGIVNRSDGGVYTGIEISLVSGEMKGC